MSKEKHLPPISEQAPVISFSCRDAKKLTSLLWNQVELLNKKRRWIVEPSAISMPDGSKKKSKRPKFLTDVSSIESCLRRDELSEIFRGPGNFQKKRLTLLTTVSPSLLSSIHKALQELDELPFQDLVAMNRKLRDIIVVPRFPPPRLSGKRDTLLERVKKRFQKVLSTLKEGADMPKPFAKALSIIQLSLKQKTRCAEIMASEFYPFSPETVKLQNEILGALWSLPKVRMHELKALQPLVDREARFPRKTFRIALRKYLMNYLFDCDVVDIPDEVLIIIESLNRPRRRLQLFSVGMMNEDMEAALTISCQLKQTVSILLPDDTIDENLEAIGSDADAESNDFDLAGNSYCSSPTKHGQGFCFDHQVEGTGDSDDAICSAMAAKNQGHSLHLAASGMIGNFSKQQPILEEEDSTRIITPQSYPVHLMEDDMVDDFIKKQPTFEQDGYMNPSQLEKVSSVGDFVEWFSLDENDINPSQHPQKASVTGGSIKKSSMDSGDDNRPKEALATAGMRETLIQEICDETSLVTYRLIGHMLDKFLLVEGRDTNEMTRYYLRGGSSLKSAGTEDCVNHLKEDMGTKILVQSARELMPSLPKSCIERVKEVMG